MVVIELHGTRFEVDGSFSQPLVTIDDVQSGYRGTYRADPRNEGRWTGEAGREVVNPTTKEDLEIALGAAREEDGKTFFRTGKRYLLVLKGGDAILGECLGPYAGQAPSILIRTDAGELAVMYRTIRTAIVDSDSGFPARGKPLEAVRVRFSCGHTGGVWPEGASPGSPHECLVCRKTVGVVATLRAVPD